MKWHTGGPRKPLTAQLLSLVGRRPSTQLYRIGSKKRVDTAHAATTGADKEILLPCHRIPNRERTAPHTLCAVKGEIIVIASAARAAWQRSRDHALFLSWRAYAKTRHNHQEILPKTQHLPQSVASADAPLLKLYSSILGGLHIKFAEHGIWRIFWKNNGYGRPPQIFIGSRALQEKGFEIRVVAIFDIECCSGIWGLCKFSSSRLNFD